MADEITWVEPKYAVLTTVPRVRAKLTKAGAQYETVLEQLVTAVGRQIQNDLGWMMGYGQRTEYPSWTGGSIMNLDCGPVLAAPATNTQAVTLKLYTATLGTDDQGEQTATLEEISKSRYQVQGTTLDGRLGKARLVGSFWGDYGWVFATGLRRPFVDYKAGYADVDSTPSADGEPVVPEEIAQVATDGVIAEFLRREMEGLEAKSVDDTTVQLLTRETLRKQTQARLADYWSAGMMMG